MKWLILIFSVLIILFTYMFLQAISYKTRYYTLSTGAGFRILQLSDIHIQHLYISAKRVKRTIQKAQPDCIVISGDMAGSPKHMPDLVTWLESLDFSVPVFATLGNHENRSFKAYPTFRRDFIQAMHRLNIQVLVNEVVSLKSKMSHSKIALVGMDDYKSGMHVDNRIFTGLKENHTAVVGVSHNPDISLILPENALDLLMTGHFHGGQIWMPFNLEFLLLRKDQLCRMGYTKGFVTIRNNTVYINQGLGTVLFPFRFFSIPEITVFDL